MSSSSEPSSSSTSSSREHAPAGRTKFKETRHPVYRGVRRRGSAGRWVCEVRVPGKRLWLGTYVDTSSASAAYSAADEVDTSSASAPSSAENAGSSATSPASALDEVFEVPAAAAVQLGSGMFDFELDMSGEMDLGSYYADFAEGMLIEPPPESSTDTILNELPS